MNKTPIEWTDFTVNPFRFRNLANKRVGHYCVKISPGCKFCYSGTMQLGPYLSGLDFLAENRTKGELFIDFTPLKQVLARGKACKIFWCDMTDMFLDDYPDEWIDLCVAVMAATGHLTHQVLTKRSRRMATYWAALQRHFQAGGVLASSARGRMVYACGKLEMSDTQTRSVLARMERLPLSNVWLGVSTEDRPRMHQRITDLLEAPAAVRFISAEPLLESLDGLEYYLRPPKMGEKPRQNWNAVLNWVITGGESGKNARDCQFAWLRGIVKDCDATNTRVFVKQIGRAPMDGTDYILIKDAKGGDISEWPKDLVRREYP